MASRPPTEERWEALYRNAYPRVYRALAATLLDADLAADVLQDAFVEGLRRPPPSDENLAGWLFRVALRKGRRAFQVPFIGDLAGAMTGRADARADSDLDQVLDRMSVGELLRLLTERQRAIVVAYYYLDLTQQEIAAVLGIKRGTVAATLAQALTRMRRGGIHVV